MTFSLWFRVLEIKFNTKIVATTAGAFFIELIPVLNALPAWTLSIVLIMLMQKSKKVLGKVAPEVSKIVDKNTGNISKSHGIRLPSDRDANDDLCDKITGDSQYFLLKKMTNKTILFFAILSTFLLPTMPVNEARGHSKSHGHD